MALETSPRIALAPRRMRSRVVAVPRVRSTQLALGLIVTLSAVVRTLGALAHPVPFLFPDEYIYAALGRSFGSSGLPLVRGSIAHFPALLEPVLTAPVWALAPTTTAYHLVQAENALFMSLAAIPAYLLARGVGLSTRYSLACSIFAVAGPGLAFSARTLADPIGYPLALGALYAAFVALTRPSARTQLAFFLLASLASLARVQYVILFGAYLAALMVTRRRDALRTHRLSLGIAAAGLLGALALGPSRALGYYSTVVHLHVGLDTLHWIGTDLFLIAVGSGVVLIPGALVGLAGFRTRTEASFTALVFFYVAALLFEAGLYASNGSDRFQGRYLLSLGPLIPIAFGLYLRNGRRMRGAVVVLAALLFLVAANLPVSGYAVSTGSTDSPFLWAVVRLQATLGLGSASLLVAVYAGAAALLAVLVAFGLRARIAFAGCILFLGLASVGATAADVHTARLVRSEFAPGRLTWVDDARLKNVTAIATSPAPDGLLTEQLYWNTSVSHEVLLGDAHRTDAFVAPAVRIAADGTLRTADGPVRTPVLFEQYGMSAVFQDATRIEQTPSFALWQPHRAARLAMLEAGRYFDGWLAPTGRITIWPRPGERRVEGKLTFTVLLPVGFKPTRVSIGRLETTVRPGEHRRVSVCVDSTGPWHLDFAARKWSSLPGFRFVSVKQTAPRFTRSSTCTASGA